MSGNLAPLPIWQFVDANGHPLAGGSVTYYQAGTQNKVTIYTDVSLDTPLPNPVPLDAAGRPATASGPTPIWFDPSRAYKQILRNAQDEVIWTADNIVSPGTGVPGPQGPPGTGVVNANYAEGDFAPLLLSLVDGTPGNGTTYAQQRGHWTRLGRLVFVTGRVALSALGTWTSDPILILGGLPFTVAPTPPPDDLDVGAVVMTFFRNFANTDYRSLYGTAEAIPSGFALMGLFAPLNLIEWLHPSNFTDSTDFAFTGFYQTTDPMPGDQGGIAIGTEEIAIGDGAQSIPLTSGFALHLVHCQNSQPIVLSSITSDTPPQVGERLIVLSSGREVFIEGGTGGAQSFVNDVESGPTPLLGGVAEYVHTPIWAGWRLIAHRQHYPIGALNEFNASYFAARPGFGTTWTVGAGNIYAQQYELIGNRIRFWLELSGTTFTGQGGDLLINNILWGGYAPRHSTEMVGTVVLTQDLTRYIGWVTVWGDDSLRIESLTGDLHTSVLGLNLIVEFEVQ